MTDGAAACTWAPVVTSAVVDCRRAAARGGMLPPTVAEALTEAAVTATVLRGAESVATRSALPGGDPYVVDAFTARRRLELAVAAVAELGTAVPAWSAGAAGALERVLVLGAGLGEWAAMSGPEVRPTVAHVLTAASFPSHRAEDLHASLALRCAALRPGVETEWGASPDAHLAGLPILTRPVADVVLAVLAARDPRCSDVVLRRFLYRRFAEAVPEGLTDRHLVRSAELLNELVTTASEPLPAR